MGWFRRILDVVVDLAEGERERRDEDPCGFAEDLRDRQKRHKDRGWDRSAEIVGRRAEEWEAKCKKKKKKAEG